MPTIARTGAAVRPNPGAIPTASATSGARPLDAPTDTKATDQPTVPGRPMPHDGPTRAETYDRMATRLEEQGRPTRDQFRSPGGQVMEWEYREAVANYDQQLEVAQQGAKPERLRRLREELATSPVGRELLEFERRAGVPITVKTDAEWRRDGERPEVLAYSAGDAGLTFNVRNLNAHVYVHEMTHQVDHRTHLLAPAGDTRTKDQVVAEATELYRRYGLDPT